MEVSIFFQYPPCLEFPGVPGHSDSCQPFEDVLEDSGSGVVAQESRVMKTRKMIVWLVVPPL